MSSTRFFLAGLRPGELSQSRFCVWYHHALHLRLGPQRTGGLVRVPHEVIIHGIECMYTVDEGDEKRTLVCGNVLEGRVGGQHCRRRASGRPQKPPRDKGFKQLRPTLDGETKSLKLCTPGGQMQGPVAGKSTADYRAMRGP